MQTVVIVGCGDIGRRVGGLYRSKVASVSGIVRTEASAQALQSSDIQPQILDLDSPLDGNMPSVRGAIVFYFAPPPREGVSDSRIRHWLAGMTANNLPSKVVLISTTAVYGDSQGAWLDETSPLSPGTDRGRRRLDAETALQDWSAEHGVPVVILRVPGIYGPGRLPRTRLEKGLPVLAETESGFTNRIHADDLANICRLAAARGVPGEVYNVSDGHPGTMTGWFNAVADHLGLPRPPQVSLAEAETQVSAGMLSYLKESRRIANTKLREELGVKLMYEDLQKGLQNC